MKRNMVLSHKKVVVVVAVGAAAAVEVLCTEAYEQNYNLCLR